MKKLSVRGLIPNLFTFISLTLGLTALKFAIDNKWEISVSLVVFASFLDNIDGKIARYLKHCFMSEKLLYKYKKNTGRKIINYFDPEG